jgi:putative transposase
LVKPAAQGKAVEHAQQLFGISERWACTILSVDRTSMRYAHRRSDDGDLRSRLREIALERRRFGYRRLGIMLAREGIVMNHKKLRRL